MMTGSQLQEEGKTADFARQISFWATRLDLEITSWNTEVSGVLGVVFSLESMVLTFGKSEVSLQRERIYQSRLRLRGRPEFPFTRHRFGMFPNEPTLHMSMRKMIFLKGLFGRCRYCIEAEERLGEAHVEEAQWYLFFRRFCLTCASMRIVI